jgi:flagellar M-ring protein FliF
MRNNMTGLLGRAARSFSTFTAGQKAVSLLALVGLIIGGVLFSSWATKPSYAPLFTNLAAKDASAIVDQLNSTGVQYQLADGGSTILVPQQQVYDTRIAMSGKGLTPNGDSDGWGLLDKQGVTASKFQQQVTYRRALEGELSKTIEGIDGVTAAVVHLAIPEKDVFIKETAQAKASVLVATAVGKSLTPAQVQAVVNLIASSVEGIDPENVTVADSTGKVLSASADGSAGAAADSRAQQTRDYEARVASSLQAMVDRVVGVGHSEVRLTADLDFDQTKTTTEKYTDSATKPIAGSSTTETYKGGGTGTGGVLAGSGVLGPDNIQVPGGTAGGGGNYSKTTATNNNALDRVIEERKSAPGAVRKLNVAVLLDTKTAGRVNPAQIQALVGSAVGLDTARGDSVVVDRLPFDDNAQQEAKAELAAAEKASAAAARTSLIKTGGLALLVLLVLGYAWLAGRRKRRAGGVTDGERIQIEALQRQLQAHERATLEGSPPVAAIEAPPADPRVELANAARSDIGELVKSQPDEVAQLLRGWLADRRS